LGLLFPRGHRVGFCLFFFGFPVSFLFFRSASRFPVLLGPHKVHFFFFLLRTQTLARTHCASRFLAPGVFPPSPLTRRVQDPPRNHSPRSTLIKSPPNPPLWHHRPATRHVSFFFISVFFLAIFFSLFFEPVSALDYRTPTFCSRLFPPACSRLFKSPGLWFYARVCYCCFCVTPFSSNRPRHGPFPVPCFNFSGFGRNRLPARFRLSLNQRLVSPLSGHDL